MARSSSQESPAPAPDLGVPVWDADNHLYEPEDAFTRHLGKKHRNAIRYVEIDGRKKIVICGQLSDYIPNPTFEVVARPGASEEWYRGRNPEGKTLRELFGKPEPCRPAYRHSADRLALMDEQGLHAALLHPTLASAMEHRMKHDAELLHAVVHAFNEWLEEEWGFHHAERIFAVPMMSLMDVERACAELEWCLARGAKAVGLRPAPVPGYKASRSPGAPEFDPWWARVAEAGVAVVVHSSDSGYEEYAAHWDGEEEYHPFQPSPLRHILMADRPIFDTMAALVCHGVFARHPGVRVLSVENGSGWVRPLLEKLERTARLMPWGFREPPRETFRRHVWVAPFYEEDIPGLARDVGVEHVLFGSDFPHPEGLAWPLSFLDELEGFGPEDTRRIMSGNLAGLLGG